MRMLAVDLQPASIVEDKGFLKKIAFADAGAVDQCITGEMSVGDTDVPEEESTTPTQVAGNESILWSAFDQK